MSGRFRNPWPGGTPAGFGALLRWVFVERLVRGRGRDRTPAGWAPERTTPSYDVPRAARNAITATWIGHSTFLVQVGGWNVLTDPVFGDRASPLPWVGPKRITPPGVALAELPPIDLVLLSHDHYDHFDDRSIRALVARHPNARWAAPTGVARRLAARGVRAVTELGWWETAEVGPLSLACVPAQHFSGRSLADRDRTLWCGWTVRAGDAPGVSDAPGVYFAGDTGLHPEFGEIARRHGPFALVLFPIGAYAPRWFMRPVHCDPDDALAAYEAIRAEQSTAPTLGGMHWGTFRLTDEPTDEPPRRTRALWAERVRDGGALWIPALGGTWRAPHGR